MRLTLLGRRSGSGLEARGLHKPMMQGLSRAVWRPGFSPQGGSLRAVCGSKQTLRQGNLGQLMTLALHMDWYDPIFPV